MIAQSGGNVGMRRGVDVGIHAQRNARLDAAPGGERINQRQFGLRLAVETLDVVFERVVDLLRLLADARKDDSPRIRASIQRTEQLTAGYNVEARAGFAEQSQNRQVAIGFHRVADFVRNVAEGSLVSLKSIEDRSARVDVTGRAFAPRDVGEGQFFEVQLLIAVLHQYWLSDLQDDQRL